MRDCKEKRLTCHYLEMIRLSTEENQSTLGTNEGVFKFKKNVSITFFCANQLEDIIEQDTTQSSSKTMTFLDIT